MTSPRRPRRRWLLPLCVAAVIFLSVGFVTRSLLEAVGLWDLASGSTAIWREFLQFLVEAAVLLIAWVAAAIAFELVRGVRWTR